MSSIDEFRRLIEGRSEAVVSGTVVGFDGQEILVRTATGTRRCYNLSGAKYGSGTRVRVQGTIILSSVSKDTGVPVYRV